METVRLQHPNIPGVVVAPATAAGQMAMSGWVPAEGEPIPTCPTCGSVWPALTPPGPAASPPTGQQTDEAPGSTGASALRSTPRSRRPSREDSE